MEYSKLLHFLSSHRMNRYYNAALKSESRALELYRLNLKISQSFYPLLNLFEICLRNAINEEVSSISLTPNGYRTKKMGSCQILLLQEGGLK